MQALAELVDRIGDIRASGSRSIHETANARLEISDEFRIQWLLLRQGIVNVGQEVAGVRERVALRLGQRAIGKEALDNLLDVLGLVQLD